MRIAQGGETWAALCRAGCLNSVEILPLARIVVEFHASPQQPAETSFSVCRYCMQLQLGHLAGTSVSLEVWFCTDGLEFRPVIFNCPVIIRDTLIRNPFWESRVESSRNSMGYR